MGMIRAMSMAGLVPGSVWKRLDSPDLFRVDVPGGGRFRYHATEGDRWRRRLYWRGTQDVESESLGAAARLLREADREAVLVDVGAYAGLYTLVACAVNAQSTVHAFEPNPASLAALRQNVNLNGWNDRVSIHPMAASDREGTAPLIASSDMSPGARLEGYREPAGGPAGFKFELSRWTTSFRGRSR